MLLLIYSEVIPVHLDLKVCDHVICQSRDDVIGACAVVVAVRRRGASPTWPCNALTRGLIIPAQLRLPHYGLVFPAFVESAMFVRGEDGDWWSSAQASVSEWQSTPLTGTYARVPLFVWTSRLHSHSLHECAEYCLRVLYEWVQFVKLSRVNHRPPPLREKVSQLYRSTMFDSKCCSGFLPVNLTMFRCKRFLKSFLKERTHQ